MRTSRPVRRARKIMLYSHDTYGLGHLRRNLRIANHLLTVDSSLRLVLVSGSSVTERFPMPQGLTVIKLPSVRKVGAEQYQALDPRVGIGVVRRARTSIMSDVARRFRPDVLLVDHSPAGMHGELLGVFDTLRRHSPATRVVLGLRDILDEPEAVIRTWNDQDIYRVIEHSYDQVVVYGSREVFDVGAGYALPAHVQDRLVYCGYLKPGVGRAIAGGAHAGGAGAHAGGPTGPYLLATAGGGGDGRAVLAAAIEAGGKLGLHTLAVSGPLMDDADYSQLEEAAARGGSVDLMRFHPNLQAAMASASAVVTMGGYNTLSEAVAAGVPTVVVPRHHPRLEQAIRAGLFAERGLVTVVDPGAQLGARIAAAVSGHPGRRASAEPLDFGGLDRLAGVLLEAPGAGWSTQRQRDAGPDLVDRLPA